MKDIVFDGHEITKKEFEKFVLELSKRQAPINPWGVIHVTPKIKKELDKAFDDYLKTKFN